jgi:hypothetical protein
LARRGSAVDPDEDDDLRYEVDAFIALCEVAYWDAHNAAIEQLLTEVREHKLMVAGNSDHNLEQCRTECYVRVKVHIDP